MKRVNTVISLLSGGLVLFLAGSAFWLSFDALQSLAVAAGISESRSWLYPAIIDGSIIIFSLSVLRANLNRETVLYPWVLVSVFTLLSIVLNIIHAQTGLLAQFMAAIPPVALFVSFELLMSQIKTLVQRVNALQSLSEITKAIMSKKQELDALIESKKQELDALVKNRTQELDELVKERTKNLDDLNEQIEQLEQKKDALELEAVQLKNERQQYSSSSTDSIRQARQAKANKKGQAKEQLLTYLDDHPNASLSEMAKAIGRSKSTAGIYISELQESGLLSKNGQGWTISGEQ